MSDILSKLRAFYENAETDECLADIREAIEELERVYAEPGWIPVEERLPDIRARLNGVRGLEADWDGDGAIAPDVGVVDAAEDLTRVLQSAPGLTAPSRVTAMPNGSISFEWDLAGGKVEVEIETAESATVSFIAPGAEVAELWTCRLPELHRRLMTVYAT